VEKQVRWFGGVGFETIAGDIEVENARLKKMYAELALENAAIKDLLGKL